MTRAPWPPVGPHRISKNETSRLPRRFVILDTEAVRTPTDTGERQTWLCGVTSYDDLSKQTKTPVGGQWAEHTDPAAMWAWVGSKCRSEGRTVLVAHNLGYDLRVGRAIPELTALGWTLQRIRLEGSQTWARWRLGKKSLVMVDLFSWLLASLEEVGRLVGLPKLELPPAGAPVTEALARCRRDVEITREAWLTLMRWLEREDLGTWQMTGAGQATTAWRHKFLAHKVVATMDTAQHEHERTAAYTGRCEVWRHGRLPRGRYVEWDLPSCYGTISRDCVVPAFPLELAFTATPATVAKTGRHTGVLARVVVHTEQPLVPAGHDGRVVWPVGDFEATLWGPELNLLTSRGASWEALESWTYRLMPALAGFAGYALELAAGTGPEHPPVARVLAHHWSRALVGRFGMRYRRFEDFATATRDDCVVYPMADAATKTVTRLLHVGRRVQIETELLEPADALPSIMSYVMSLARVRLWTCAEAAGLEHVVYLDTDSLIVDGVGHRRLRDATARGELWGLRPKGGWESVELRAPRQIILGPTLRAAGIPRKAVQDDDGRWAFTVWRGLGASIAARETDSVVLTDRRARLRGIDRRRTHNADGSTSPHRLTAPAEGLDGPQPAPAVSGLS